jgi:hypothetical protein
MLSRGAVQQPQAQTCEADKQGKEIHVMDYEAKPKGPECSEHRRNTQTTRRRDAGTEYAGELL